MEFLIKSGIIKVNLAVEPAVDPEAVEPELAVELDPAVEPKLAVDPAVDPEAVEPELAVDPTVEPKLTVQTDSTHYNEGDIITVSGNITGKEHDTDHNSKWD